MRRRAAQTTLSLLVACLPLLALANNPQAPQLWVEAPTVVEIDRTFHMRVSADRPVTFTLTYADWTVEQVDQALDVQLTAQAGVRDLTIEAVDRNGETTTQTVTLTPVRPVEPRWIITGGSRPGDPFRGYPAYP